MLQPIGAFKIRGAWHRISDLTAVERERGVVGVSSGNHAQGVAWAAKRLGIAAKIVMPENAPRSKIEATRALGAEVVLYRRPGQDRDAIAPRFRLLSADPEYERPPHLPRRRTTDWLWLQLQQYFWPHLRHRMPTILRLIIRAAR